MTKPFLASISALLLALFSVLPAQAASLYFEPASAKLGVGETVRVSFLMDSPEHVNALEGQVVYPNDLLEVKSINDGSSIVSFWIARPKAEGGKIVFVGVIPGGYADVRGKIFSVDFVAKKAGRGALSLSNTQALLNDGQGSQAQLSLSKLAVTITGKAAGKPAPPPPEIKDEAPPEEFKPTIASDPEIFDGRYFLVFAAQDKGVGIDYYEVAEAKGLFRPSPDVWEKAESLHLLKDQELKSWVFVRAVDKNGNTRSIVLPPPGVRFYQLLTIFAGILIAVVLLIVWRRLKKRWRS